MNIFEYFLGIMVQFSFKRHILLAIHRGTDIFRKNGWHYPSLWQLLVIIILANAIRNHVRGAPHVNAGNGQWTWSKRRHYVVISLERHPTPFAVAVILPHCHACH